MRASHPPSRVDDVLQRVLQRVDPDKQLHAHGIWNFWDDTVGPTIARRARPARFRNGILFVTVASHSWMQELQFVKEDICTNLNARLGSALVRDIFFHTGRIDAEEEGRPAAPGRHLSGNPLVPLPAMGDDELAACFARVVQARARRLAADNPPRKRRRRP